MAFLFSVSARSVRPLPNNTAAQQQRTRALFVFAPNGTGIIGANQSSAPGSHLLCQICVCGLGGF